MKKLSIILAVLAVCGLVVMACGDDGDGGKGKCVKAWTLIPCATEDSPTGCDYAGETPLCCNDTCVAMPTDGCADMANACEAPQVCDYCAATPECKDPATDPCEGVTCDAGEGCVDGKCKKIPVCDPVCADDEYCI